jgi:hypothetical protein
VLQFTLSPDELIVGETAKIEVAVRNATNAWCSNLSLDFAPSDNIVIESATRVRGVSIGPEQEHRVALRVRSVSAGRHRIRVDNLSYRRDGAAERPAAPIHLTVNVVESVRVSAAPVRTVAPAVRAGDTQLASYWVERGPPKPIRPPQELFISFASGDERGEEKWSSKIETIMKPMMEMERFQPPFRFDDQQHGTTIGRTFPEQLVERMSLCKAAFVLLSSNYLNSNVSRRLELPYLLWRRECDGILVIPVLVGPISFSVVPYPHYLDGPSSIDLAEIVNRTEQNALGMSEYSTLQALRDANRKDEIERRLIALGKRVIGFLKEGR